MPPPIYHITHLNNLPSILRSGGLIANSRLRQQQINYTDIAYAQIQDRRAITPVLCGAGGTLHDYVPFYFAPRSPMLYTIHRGNVREYQDGQNSTNARESPPSAIAGWGGRARKFEGSMPENFQTLLLYR